MSGLGNCGWETPYGGRRAENGRANETATDSYGAKSWPEEPYALIGLVRDCGGAIQTGWLYPEIAEWPDRACDPGPDAALSAP